MVGQSDSKSKNETVLCVDPSQVMAKLYAALFANRAFTLRMAETAEQAMAEFEADPADLVVLELLLPDMDGVELVRHLRRQRETYDVPIMAISKCREETDLTRAYTAGVDEYLIKPVSVAELMAKTENLLRRKRAATAGSGNLPSGSLFAGRYEIDSLLGHGGHSAVYAVRDIINEETGLLVCKIFNLAFYQQGDDDYLSLFLREAFEHSRLKHENIVEFIDFGQAGGKYFIVEEYLRGLNISEMVEEQGPLKEDNLLFVGFAIADVLVYLEAHGIIHRDIKPGNIMATHDGQVKLLDFGLARKTTDRTLSLNDEFMGTPHFCSPEYVRSAHDLDSRTDVYSLGVTLYWAAAGHYPIRGDSPLDILEKQLHMAPTPLFDITDGVSQALSDAIGKMLEKDRNKRPGPVEARKLLQNILFKKDRQNQKGEEKSPE